MPDPHALFHDESTQTQPCRFLLNPRSAQSLSRQVLSSHITSRNNSREGGKTAIIMSEKLVLEYAKSARASCKVCNVNLAKGSVRVGSISKGGAGFDLTRWFHPECFMKKSFKGDVNSLNEVAGFKLLKAGDQEKLKSLAADSEKSCTEGPSKKPKIEEEKGGGSSEGELKLIIDFTPSQLTNNYKGADLPEGWKAFSTVILNERATDETLAKDKVAAFDFDGCLANTSVHRHGPDAWSLLYPSIPKKLQEYHNEGYKLVIFTNESTIDRWKNSRQKAIDSKIGRLEGFMKLIDAPIQVLISCGKDNSDFYRKPKQGMWLLFERHFNGGVPIDKTSSLFVGDAAGRRTDHSDADLAFAKAAGLKFFLPEDVF